MGRPLLDLVGDPQFINSEFLDIPEKQTEDQIYDKDLINACEIETVFVIYQVDEQRYYQIYSSGQVSGSGNNNAAGD